MSASVIRLGCQLFVPGGLLLAAAIVLFQLGILPPAVDAFLPFYPGLVLAAGLFLGWRFNRSRLVFALLVLALADRALLHFSDGEAASLARGAVTILLPLNLVFFSLLVERGIFTLRGLQRLALILVQPLAVVWLGRQYPEAILHWLDPPLPFLRIPAALSLSAPAVGVFLFALLVLCWLFLRRRGALDGGFLWALLTVFTPLALDFSTPERTLYFATAGLILAVAGIETSYGMAFRDELTGLPARRALNETLQKMGRCYTVAMVDVDHFKKVNDRHGHDVGDQVLKMVSTRLMRVSGGGRPFRYGGEEFTVLFPGKGADEATAHLEELRKVIGAASFTLRHRRRPRKKPQGNAVKKKGDKKLKVTVSIGVAERTSERGRPMQVIKAADRALYRAKRGGRNRLCG